MSRFAEGHRLPTFLLLCTFLAVFQVYVIFWQPHGTPSTTGGERRKLGEVAGAVTARQTFEMEANGLEAITIYPAESPGARGSVVFELAELSGEPVVEQMLFRDARDVAGVGRGAFTWRFQPIEGSRGRRYALTVSMPDAPNVEGQAMSLQATRGERYADGELTYDGTGQWGDLVFATEAARATSFRRFEHALRDKPRWLRSRVTQAAAFLLYNAALFTIFWTILTAPEEERPPGDAARASPSSRARLAIVAPGRTHSPANRIRLPVERTLAVCSRSSTTAG